MNKKHFPSFGPRLDYLRGKTYFATDCIRLPLSLRKTKKHKVVAAEVAVADAMRKWRDLM